MRINFYDIIKKVVKVWKSRLRKKIIIMIIITKIDKMQNSKSSRELGIVTTKRFWRDQTRLPLARVHITREHDYFCNSISIYIDCDNYRMRRDLEEDVIAVWSRGWLDGYDESEWSPGFGAGRFRGGMRSVVATCSWF